MIVIDASVALAWHFEDEDAPEAEEVLDQVIDGGAVVPVHWRAEIANSFAVAVRRGRMTAGYRAVALEKLGSLEIEIDRESDVQLWSKTQGLCDDHQLSAYDAAYLELALRRQLPLATLDRRLADAAAKAGSILRLSRR